MNLKEFIVTSVNDCINEELKGQESLRNLCKNHERLPLLYERITKEVDDASKRIEIKRETVKQLTGDFTKIFIQAAKKHKDHQLMTDCQKDAMNSKASKAKEAEQLWDEIIIDNSRVDTYQKGFVNSEAF